MPYVFTEYGITMLAGLLKSDIAVQASIKIVNQFIEMKKTFKGIDLYKNIITFENKVNDKFLEYDNKFDFLFSELNNDNFLDDNVLNILSKKIDNVNVLLVSSDKCKINDTDIDKFNKQYPLVSIKYMNIFHDRFIIIDNSLLYHLGTSLNYLGSKVFAINKIEDKEILNGLISKIAV